MLPVLLFGDSDVLRCFLTSALPCSNWSSTTWQIGSIMAAVAVLLIHMERNAVGSMKPSSSLYKKIQDDTRIFS